MAVKALTDWSQEDFFDWESNSCPSHSPSPSEHSERNPRHGLFMESNLSSPGSLTQVHLKDDPGDALQSTPVSKLLSNRGRSRNSSGFRSFSQEELAPPQKSLFPVSTTPPLTPPCLGSVAASSSPAIDAAGQSVSSVGLGSGKDMFQSNGMLVPDDEITDLEASITHGSAPKRVRKGLPIGRGGFGTVYLGLNVDNGTLLAVKEFTLIKPEKELKSAKQEYALYCMLQHPNIVKQHGFYYNDFKAEIYMEYVPGGSVASVIKQFGYLHESIICQYIRQLLEGLHFLHSHNIIHRDIKPHNLLLDSNGVIKLSDFGSCWHTQNKTKEWSISGTPAYMPAEAIKGDISIASDIWAVGCAMSEMATGLTPWSHLGATDTAAIVWYIGNHPKEHPTVPDHLSENARNFLYATFGPPEARPSSGELKKHTFLQRDYLIGSNRDVQAVDTWVVHKANLNQAGASQYTLMTRSTISEETLEVESLFEPVLEPWIPTPSQCVSNVELDLVNGSREMIRRELDSIELGQHYPANYTNPIKRQVHELACGPTNKHLGSTLTRSPPQAGSQAIVFSRWRSMLLPELLPPKSTHYMMHTKPYDYEALSPQELPTLKTDKFSCVDWHVHFASPQIFQHYDADFLGPDDLQVMEHPMLASVREWLKGSAHAWTSAPEREGTPILISGVQRKIKVVLNADASGHGNGAHGVNRENIAQAVTELKSNANSNIVAVTGPSNQGPMKYNLQTVMQVFLALYSAFVAVRLETQRMHARQKEASQRGSACPNSGLDIPRMAGEHFGDSFRSYKSAVSSKSAEEELDKINGKEFKTVIHTGNWGTGSFGGNQVLMALLQLVAARAARIDVLVFHAVRTPGNTARPPNARKGEAPIQDAAEHPGGGDPGHDYTLAYDIMKTLIQDDQPTKTMDVLQKIHDLGFHWQ